MLLVQAFTDLISQIDNGALIDVIDAELLSKVSICLFQACLRTTLGQEMDGSWNGQPEETCYALLTLTEAARLVFFNELQPQIKSAVDRATVFLESNVWTSPDHHWTSKTVYRAAFVAESYRLAAIRAGSDPFEDNAASIGQSLGLLPLPSEVNDYLRLVRQTKHFQSTTLWEIRASFMESALFLPLLRAQRSKVYQRDQMGVSNDNYLTIIPFTWISCNNRSRTYVASSMLFDMMILSMLGYQTDEFIESIAAPAFADSTANLHGLIDGVFDSKLAMLAERDDSDASFTRSAIALVTARKPPRPGISQANGADGDLDPVSMNGFDSTSVSVQSRENIRIQIQQFVHYVLGHPRVLRASLHDQRLLEYELRAFLHAHATQVKDNMQLVQGTAQKSKLAKDYQLDGSFFRWVRTTGADHVACAYSFAFVCCLTSSLIGNGDSMFPTIKESYLVQAAARHMATMCRMCNDVGSITRDIAEGNMNSVHFPEFERTESLSERKRVLTELAEYEHDCLLHTLSQLEEEFRHSKILSNACSNFSKRKMDIIRFYAEVTDFYDQLYLLRDLSSTID